MPDPQQQQTAPQTPPPQQTLAQLVKSKYPGAYDDMKDTDLEASVLAKHPEYSDLPRSAEVMPENRKPGAGLAGGTSATMQAQPQPWSLPWLKGKLVGAEDSFSRALPAAGAMIGGFAGAPGGPAGAIGGAGIGGMGGAGAKQLMRRALGFGGPATTDEAAKDIMGEGAIQGGIQGVTEGLPFLAGPLQRSAASQYERALAPTTKVNKAITQKITPELINRGEYGSLGGLEERAGQQATALKPQLDAAYQAMPAQSTAGSGPQIVQALENLKGKYTIQGMPANPQAVNAISGVQDVVKQYGNDIAPDSLRKLKRIFDDPVAARGGFAGTDLTTAYTLKAQKAASNQIRGILGQASPDVATLNKEISFWLDVQRVTSQSGLRQTGQAGGLLKVLSPLGAGAAGAMTGAQFGAHAGLEAGAAAALTTAAIQITRSPLWRTGSAVLKDKLADALARGSVGEVSALAARFGVAATKRNPWDNQTGQPATPQTGLQQLSQP